MFIEPVTGKDFFGREDVLATLHKRMNAMKGGYRQNLALAGPMLSGKSSILRHFLKSVNEPDFITLYVELSGESFDIFCMRFITTLLYQYFRSTGEKIFNEHHSREQYTFGVLREYCAEKIPKTVRAVDTAVKHIEHKKYDFAYEIILDIPAILKSETGKNTIVIFDEFHNLANFKLKKPFHTFGKFIMLQKNTMYIVSSSQKTLLKDILSQKLSLLFGNFEVVDVEGFDNKTALSFLSDKADGAIVSDKIKKYVIQLTRGNPFYLNAIFKKIFSLSRSSDDVRKTDEKEWLLAALAELLYESGGILNQYFTNNINFFLEKGARKKFIPMIIALSESDGKMKNIASHGARMGAEEGELLRNLQYMDLVYKNGIFYKIEDKLFEFWIKNVYSVKTRSEIDDTDIKYFEFKKRVEDEYNNFCVITSQPIINIITDLFKSFNGEKISLGMNERKLPCFESVNIEKPFHGMFKIQAKSGSNVWVCFVKQDDFFNEDDAHNIIALKNEGEFKISKKIIVPLKGIENNAFLMAKDNNLWIFDVPQLNEILRLFGKYEIVI
ncbi:ATPase domain protein, prokaryote domain protein [Candidatus Omnitrophus magneticus]|uniref:ATPase domain protein, prokaryote domain protein n=1 Tax=Candidatus Omnitrophus magneticus TaxID=1609969 RepID=A0A0F0CJ33_9BACT|nr:ATPase domain protein, prokaryote domain protein [Candidatus Omnitrophus magneticus]